MLSVEDGAEIRRLHRSEGVPIKVIARVMGISNNTVEAYCFGGMPMVVPKHRVGVVR